MKIAMEKNESDQKSVRRLAEFIASYIAARVKELLYKYSIQQ